MEKQADIRILIACHKPTYVPENPLFYPIQVGTALTDRHTMTMRAIIYPKKIQIIAN